MIENEMTVSVPLEVVKASEIEPKEVKWLWYPYIPFGKVTLLHSVAISVRTSSGNGFSSVWRRARKQCPGILPTGR